MVSAFTHGAFAVALGSLFPRAVLPRRAWILGAVCSAAPDLDSILHWSGVPYSHVLGHRGLTHSIPFALVFAALVVWIVRRTPWRQFPPWPLYAYLALAIGSHGVFDAMTNGGMGIAFLAPFSAERWFLPWDPIQVAPISVRGFFTAHGWRVFQSELLWVWLPSFTVAGIVALFRAVRARRAAAPTAAP